MNIFFLQGTNGDNFWATMKPQSFERNMPFANIADKQSSLNRREEKDNVTTPYNNKMYNPIDNITKRHLSYNTYETDTMKSSIDMTIKGEKEQHRSETLHGIVKVDQHKGQMYDIDSKHANNGICNPGLVASSQYVITPKHYSNMANESHASLTQINAIQSASCLAPVSSKDAEASHKWDQVINAKDNLIKKKDAIIERYEIVQPFPAEIEIRLWTQFKEKPF